MLSRCETIYIDAIDPFHMQQTESMRNDDLAAVAGCGNLGLHFLGRRFGLDERRLSVLNSQLCRIRRVDTKPELAVRRAAHP